MSLPLPAARWIRRSTVVEVLWLSFTVPPLTACMQVRWSWVLSDCWRWIMGGRVRD
jgi:hypothetical protein